MMFWKCQFCTLENPFGNDICDVCGNPAPPPKAEEVYDIVEATDLKAAEKKLKEK